MTDAASSDAAEPPEISPLHILAVLLRRRRLLTVAVVAGLVVATGVALFQDREYLSTFSFVPQSAQDPTRAGLAGLAGQLGVTLGASATTAQPPQLYADLLSTRELLLPIARDTFVIDSGGRDSVPLVEFLRVRDRDRDIAIANAIEKLRTHVIKSDVATRTTGVVTVEVRTRSPQVSLSIARRLLEGLDQFNLVTRRSQAGEERRFTEGQLTAARAALRADEDQLEAFLQSNRGGTDSPNLTFARDRLQRAVTLQQDVVAGLEQHFEEARIREVRDTPVITVIEPPSLAVQAEPRGRLLIVIAGLLTGSLMGIVAALVSDGIDRARTSGSNGAFNELRDEWVLMRAARE